MRKLSEEPPPRGTGGWGQVTIMAKKKVKIDHFLIFLSILFFSVKIMSLGLLCDVLHNEGPDFDLTVLLWRGWILLNHL